MSSPSLYAAVSAATQSTTVPKDAEAKAHHPKAAGGRFQNPWDSWNEMNPGTIIWGLIKFVYPDDR